MTKIPIPVALIACLAGAGPAWAATTVPPPTASPALDLRKAVAIALDRNPRVRDAEIGIALAEAQLEISRSYCGDTTPAVLSARVAGTLATAPLGCELGIAAAATVSRVSSLPFFATESVLGGVVFGRALETGGSLVLSADFGRISREGTFGMGASIPADIALTLEHPLLNGLELSFEPRGVKRAKIDVDVAERNVEWTASEVVRDVIDAYWAYYFTLQRLRIARSGVKITKRELERVKALRDIGGGAAAGGGRMLITDLDVMVVERKLMEREVGIVDADIAVRNARVMLRKSMGLPYTTHLGEVLADRPPAAGDDAVAMIDPADAATRAVAWNPNAAAMRANIDKSKLTLKDVRNAALPLLNLAASIGVTSETPVESEDPGAKSLPSRVAGDLFSADGLVWSVGLTFGFPIMNRAGKAAVEAGELSIDRNKELLRDFEDLVASLAINSALRVRAAARRLELNRRALELAEASLTSAEARAEVGALSEFDKLDVLDALQQARMAEVASEVELLRAVAALRHQTGDLLSDYGVELR